MIVKKKHLSAILCSLLLSNISLFAQEKDDTTKLESITVEAKSDYTKLNRNNINIGDTPKSIQVFNEALIKDLQPQSIEEIITMSSNVVSFGDNNGRENEFAIRGFMDLPILRDGVSVDNAIANPEVYNLESIEVLKGPDSLQFGEGGAGGLINLVTKKPDRKDFFGEVVLEANSESKKGVKFDVGGSLNEDGSARFRLVSAYSKQSDYKNYNVDIDSIFVAPSLAYDINDSHTITFITEYLKRKEPVDYGSIISSDGELEGTYDSILNHPDDDMTSSQKTFGFDLNSSFSSWDSLFKYRYVNYIMDIGDTYTPASYNSSTDTINRMYSYMEQENKEHILQYTANKDFDIADMLHQVTVGIDYRKFKQKADNKYYFDRFDSNYGYHSVDFSDQIFESSMNTASDYSSLIAFGGTGVNMNRYGAFIQDSIDVSDDLILNLGVRHDRNDIKQYVNNHSYRKKATTPSLGAVYKLNEDISFFVNYSQSFNMQEVRYTDSNGDLLDPAEGIGYELGLKQKLFDGKMNLSASIFKIDKKNMPVYESSTRSYTATSTQNSKGLEVDINGQITPDWSVVASYGYTKTNADYISSVAYYDKNIVGVPKHSANIFTTYYVNENVYLSGNVRYIGERYVDYSNATKVDSSTILNASVGYKTNKWKFILGLKNITDEEYFEAVGARGLGSLHRNNFLGAPRTLTATLSYSF